MLFSVTLLVSALLSWLAVSVRAQVHGDIRLVDSPQRNYGRVEIFYEGRWGTICDVNYRGAANTICHQLNHTYNSVDFPGTNTVLMNKALTAEKKDTIANKTSSPILLRDIDCGAIYSTPLATIHILRCDLELVDQDIECSHDNDLAVFCEDPPRQEPYDSEIRLVGGNFASAGTLEIYHDKEWGNICYHGFNETAADTACRQMGYTHASKLSAAKNTQNITWLSGKIICDKTASCLSECVKVKSFNRTSCADGDYVSLQCKFDQALAVNASSGNAISCSLRPKFSKTPAYFFAIMSVSGGLWAVSVGVIITSALCYSVEKCPCYRGKLSTRRRRDNFSYYSINK